MNRSSSSIGLQDLPFEIQNCILGIVLKDCNDHPLKAICSVLQGLPFLIGHFLLITDDTNDMQATSSPGIHFRTLFPQMKMTTLLQLTELPLFNHDQLPPIKIFHFCNIEDSLKSQYDNGELSLWSECLYERFIKKDDIVCAYVYEAGSIASYMIEKICKRKKAKLTTYSTPSEEQHYWALKGSSLLMRGKNPYEKIWIPLGPYFDANRRFEEIESQEQWRRVDLTDCVSVERLRLPHVEEFRVVLREGCIESRADPCAPPQVAIAAPGLSSFQVFFHGSKFPIIYNTSWGYQTQITIGTLEITNSSYLEHGPHGRHCTHSEGERITVSCNDWTSADRYNFRNFTSNFLYLSLLGVPDEALRLTSWERVEILTWERLPSCREANEWDPQTGSVKIRAQALRFLKFNSLLKASDPVPQFSAPSLETILLTALKGSSSAWDFNRLFKSNVYMDKVRTISIKHPSGSNFSLKPFEVPQSTIRLSIMGCHAPWLLFDHTLNGGLPSVLPNLTMLSIDISQLIQQVRGELNETGPCDIFLDITRKYPALTQLILMAQLCSSSVIDERGIALNLATSGTIRKLQISPFIPMSSLKLNNKDIPLQYNPCPKIPHYLRVWEFTHHVSAPVFKEPHLQMDPSYLQTRHSNEGWVSDMFTSEVEAEEELDLVGVSVSRYPQGLLESTEDFW